MTSDQLQTYVDRALGNKLEEKEREILDKNHPVGSIYITETNINPTTLFGGTWISYGQGRTLVGLDSNNTDFNTVGKTGGNVNGKTTLTTAQLPSHNHTFTPSGSVKSTFTGNQVNTSTIGNHTHDGIVFLGIEGNDILPANTGYLKSNTFEYSTVQKKMSGLWTKVNPAGSHAHTVTATGSVASTFTGTKSTTSNTGSGEAFSTQDPYITVYMWKRTK